MRSSNPAAAPRIPRDEPYPPLKCLVGVLIANLLLWAFILEVIHLAGQAWRWICS